MVIFYYNDEVFKGEVSMIKNIIGGIAVGIANVIPGVSGGTMMVILGIFNRMMDAISGILIAKKILSLFFRFWLALELE